VEFGIIFPIMLVMLVGVVDLGRAFFESMVVHQAAQEGALTAGVYGNRNATCGADSTGRFVGNEVGINCANRLVKESIMNTAPAWVH